MWFTLIDCRMFSSFFSLFFRAPSNLSVAGILNSVAIQKRLMLDFLIDNCTLNLTPMSNQSSPLTMPATTIHPSIPTPPLIPKPYSCLNKCGQSYDSLSSLQHHMRLECCAESAANMLPISMAKRFDCIYCSETFTRRDKLKLHIHDKHLSMID